MMEWKCGPALGLARLFKLPGKFADLLVRVRHLRLRVRARYEPQPSPAADERTLHSVSLLQQFGGIAPRPDGLRPACPAAGPNPFAA
jgi:hypothetical protein